MLKNKKKFMIPVLAMILIVAMSANAFATSSAAFIMGGNGTDYGDPAVMSGTIRRAAECYDVSTSQCLTTYVQYGQTKWQWAKTIDNGKEWTNVYNTLPSGYHAVEAVLEALWGNNSGCHYVYDN